MVAIYRCPGNGRHGRCEMHLLIPEILSPPFKTVSVLHACEWNRLHIVFTISCNHLISFECMSHLHSAITWPLVASSPEQVFYFPRVIIGPFRPKSPFLSECFSNGLWELWISVNVNTYVWAAGCIKIAKRSCHGIQDSVPGCWGQLRNG